MKLVIDERAKHRMVGIAVLLSIVVVFAPAILKKSQQRFEDSVSISVKLPPKPALPDVAVRKSKALFDDVKVAKVDLPKVSQPHDPEKIIAQAEPLSQKPASVTTAQSNEKEDLVALNTGPSELVEAINSHLTQHIKTAPQPEKVVAQRGIPRTGYHKPTNQRLPQKIAIKPTVKPTRVVTHVGEFGVQLGSFAQRNNAIALVSKLKSKGYTASYYAVNTKGVVYYKVIAGHAVAKDQAQLLQRQLAQSFQLNGFVVAKGVG